MQLLLLRAVFSFSIKEAAKTHFSFLSQNLWKLMHIVFLKKLFHLQPFLKS